MALLGALGGALNAGLCLARIPEPVREGPDFNWAILPGGAAHGGGLAVLPLLAARCLAGCRLRFRLLAALPVGWMAGYLSWAALHHALFDNYTWVQSLLWLWEDSSPIDSSVVWGPLAYFGLVGSFWYLVLALGGPARGRKLSAALGAGAAVAGSLWFWISFGPWYFAVLHGTVWGTLVGWGAAGISLLHGSRIDAERR